MMGSSAGRSLLSTVTSPAGLRPEQGPKLYRELSFGSHWLMPSVASVFLGLDPLYNFKCEAPSQEAAALGAEREFRPRTGEICSGLSGWPSPAPLETKTFCHAWSLRSGLFSMASSPSSGR